MFGKNNEKRDFNSFRPNCQVLKSLCDVECFLRKLTCVSNSLCLAKKTKYFIDKSRKF